MTVVDLLERLTRIGATVTVDGDQVAVCFPEEHRRDVEELGSEIRCLKPELLRTLREQNADHMVAASKEALHDDHFARPPEKGRLIPASAQCPPLPLGVRLIRYLPKAPPVDVSVCLVVVDVATFISRNLEELDARLNHPVQIRSGGSVFEILARLAEVGVEVSLEPPVGPAG
jgi:hypothetical protein